MRNGMNFMRSISFLTKTRSNSWGPYHFSWKTVWNSWEKFFFRENQFRIAG